MLSGSERTSTLISKLSSSSGLTGLKRGSRVAALIAFSAISSATELRTGCIVPMQPRSLPSLCRETNVPARCQVISGGRSSGSGSLLRSLIQALITALASLTKASSFARFSMRTLLCSSSHFWSSRLSGSSPSTR